MIRWAARLQKLVSRRTITSFTNKEDLEAFLSEKLEAGLRYLENLQRIENTEEGKEEIVKSIMRTNYLTKYALYHAMEEMSENSTELKVDPEFQVGK